MLAVSRGPFSALRSFTILTLAGAGVLVACSSEVIRKAPPACDSSKCAPGNECLPLNGEVKCRKTCSSNADPATSCPFGYTCTDTETGASPFCVQDSAVRDDDGAPLVKKPTGQWGASCQASLGIENPDCDTEQGFWCYGESPTDANAYCTRYYCESDSDCGAGFWCGKINRRPNVQTAKRTFGEVDRVCLRRTYCAPCRVDLDCPPVKGVAQHCVDDVADGRFCAPECDTSQACLNEAYCGDVGGVKVCYPRAKVCVGDGALCAPCSVDDDCAEGVCAKGSFTTEKACTKKVSSCEECPKTLESPARGVGCSREELDTVPKDHCLGLYKLGEPRTPDEPQGYDIGCWTPDRLGR